MEKQKGQNLDYGRGGRSPKSPEQRETKTAKPPIKGFDQEGKPVYAKRDKPQLSKP